MPLPATRGLYNPHLAASAPDNVWLFAGMFGPRDANDDPTEIGVARRWDGQQWLSMPIDFSAIDVAVLAPDDVWALSAELVDGKLVSQHWDGQRWTAHVLPYSAESLSASGPRNLWAVGRRQDATGPERSQPVAMRFDGTAWQVVPTPEQRSSAPAPDAYAGLTEVVAIAEDNVWAFGYHDNNPAAPDASGRYTIMVLHWDGSAWSKAPQAPEYTADIRPFPRMAASGDGAGGFVLSGYRHGASTGTLRVIEYPDPPPATANAPSPTGRLEVNDVKLVPGTRDVWAVGVMGFGASNQTSRAVVAVCTLNGR